MSSPKLQVKKLSPHAILPVRASAGAAGYDLSSAYAYIVKARGRELVITDLAIKVPELMYGRIAPRSGLALKNGIDVGAGVIDSDYRGPVGVILFNHGDIDFKIAPGDRIAQLIIERIAFPEVEEIEQLGLSARGEGGFGSTGVSGSTAMSATGPVTAAGTGPVAVPTSVNAVLPSSSTAAKGSARRDAALQREATDGDFADREGSISACSPYTKSVSTII